MSLPNDLIGGSDVIDDAALGLAVYLERRGDYAAEVIWTAALAIIRNSLDDLDARGHWRTYPRGHLRRLRTGVVEGFELARLAVNLQDGINEREFAIERDARAKDDEAGRRRRRAQTLPAELARLANAAARRAVSEENRPRTNFHLTAAYRRRSSD